MKKILQMFALVAMLATPWVTNAQFCTPDPTSKDGSGITNVTFGAGSETVNSSPNWVSAPYYINYSSQIGAVPAGTSCEMSITFATGYTYVYIIWVDWNNDSTFSGTEVVYVGESPSANPTTEILEFDVPALQDTGTYMLRICAADMAFDSYSGSIAMAANANPCNTYSYGVGLDYTLRVTEAASCFRVASISASNILSDGMTINWVDSLNVTTYTLSYWPEGASAGDTVEVPGLSGNSYVLTGLESNTFYHVSIVPDCSDGSVAPRMGTFKTDCGNGSCNITINMIDSYGDGWNGNAINVVQGGVVVGTATITSGSSGTMDVPVCKLAPVTLTYTSGSYASEMGGTVTDGGGSVIFTIENMGSAGATLVTVPNACPDCIAPVILSDSIDADGNVVLTWSSEATTFMVYAGDSLYDANVVDTFYTFTGLSASNVYQLGVAAICDGGDTSSVIRRSVATPCGSITSLPWTTGFENDQSGVSPMCWNVLRTTNSYGTTYPYVYNYSTHSGSRDLYFSTQYNDDTNLVTTSLITINPGNLHVQFWLYTSFYYGSTFEAGLMTDLNDMSSFISLFSINESTPNYSYAQFEFFTDQTGLEEGDSAYLAFRMVGPNGTGYGDYAYLDDIVMATIPSCRMPMMGSGVIDSVSYESAHFAWDGNSESGYDLMLVHYVFDDNNNVTDTVVSHVFCDSSYITVDTLIPNTVYYAYVATICNEDGVIDTTDYLDLGMFATQMRCYPVSRANISTLTTNTAVIGWNYQNMGISGSGAIVTLTDLGNSSATPTTQVVTGATSVTLTGLTQGHTYSVTISSLCGTEDTAEMQTLYFTPHAPECTQAFTDAQVDNNYTSSAPIYGYYKYSSTQAIYTDDMLVGLDTLTGVAFDAYNYSLEYIGVNNYEVDMYIGYVDTSILTYYNGQYWLPNGIHVDNTMTKVATGSLMSATGNGWFYLPFDTPFVVAPQNSAKRLLVTVVGHTLSLENSNNSWRGLYDYTYTSDYTYYYKARYAYSSSAPIDPTVASYSNNSYYVPNLRFFGNCGGDCLAPSVTLANVHSNSATLSWLSNGDETSWQVEYKLASDTAWTLAATVNASPYTINGLVANTAYNVRVGAVCTDTVTYATLSFSTPCAAITIPYNHTFTSADPCWNTNISYYSTDGLNIYSDYYLISPELPAPVSDLMAIITDRCYSTTASNQGYYVAIGDASGNNLTIIDTVYATEGTQFGTHMVFFSNYTGPYNNIYIAHTNGDFYIKSITIDLAPHCMPATGLTLDSTGLNTLGISWTSDASSFQVNYRPEGDTGAWSIVTVNNPYAVLTGLTPSTNYNVEVRPVCADGTLSFPVSDVFGTSCLTYNTPYRQTYFTSMPICWSAFNTGHPSTTWAESVADGAGYIYSYASGSSTPVNDWLMSPEIVIPTTAAADSIMLVYKIAGSADSYTSGSVASYMVLVSTNGGSATADYTDTLFSEVVASSTFDFRRFSLSQYAGNTIRIAFRSTCAAYGMVGMYDFGVRSVLFPMYSFDGEGTVFVGDNATYTATCFEGDSTTMTLSWTSTKAAAGQAVMSGANTSVMNITYSADGYDTITLYATNSYGADTVKGIVRVIDLAPVNFYPYSTGFESTNSDNFSWVTVNGSNAWVLGSAVNNGGTQSLYISYDGGTSNNYNGTVSAVSYAYRALNCNDTGDYTIQFDWNVNGESNYDYLRAFLVTDSAFSVTADAYPGGVSSSYNFYNAEVEGWTSLGGKLNLASAWQTELDTINITNPGRYFLVFLWSNDGSVEHNPAAAVDNIVVTSPGICLTPSIDSILVGEVAATIRYSNVAAGYEVAIVEGAWNEPATGTAVADTFYTFTGLTEQTQYTIGVRAICGNGYSEWDTITITTLRHPCAVPTNVAVTDPSYDGATVSWTIGEAETEWQVRVFCASPLYDDTIDVSGTPSTTIHGLANDAVYSVAVRAVCDVDWASPWSDTVTLTPANCPQVTGVGASNVTATTATISWTSTDAASYEIEYGNRGFTQGTGTTVTATTNSVNLTGLEAENNYDVYVRSVCVEGVTSVWSAKYTFTTPQSDGIDDVAGSNVTLFPNPASEMVTIRGIEGECTVTVVDLNGREVYKTNANNTLTIYLTGYAKGAYFVRITGERTMAIRKLIVK